MCGSTRRILEGRGELGYDIVDLDTKVPLAEAHAKMPASVILGNIATVEVLRNGTVEEVVNAVTKCHRDAGDLYIIAAGCEVPRDTPVENMFALLEYARTHQPGVVHEEVEK
jgi:uroporphyrinogen-III decarboxylase